MSSRGAPLKSTQPTRPIDRARRETSKSFQSSYTSGPTVATSNSCHGDHGRLVPTGRGSRPSPPSPSGRYVGQSEGGKAERPNGIDDSCVSVRVGCGQDTARTWLSKKLLFFFAFVFFFFSPSLFFVLAKSNFGAWSGSK